MPENVSQLDVVWICACAGLVLFMQAGFLCLESGQTRNKNSINVAIKNLTDLCLSVFLFWLVGYGLMFGDSIGGIFGGSGFRLDVGSDAGLKDNVFFLFQTMFCGTAVTILSGGVAERVSFKSYLIAACVISCLIYPVFGHWVWGGMMGGEVGWLKGMGFIDFAGASVVHGIGGFSALACVMVIGARQGFCNEDGTPCYFKGSNLPLSMLGVVILWVGWMGFNGGAMLVANDKVPGVLVNTVLAGAGGAIAALVAGWFIYGFAAARFPMNGSLGGLVSVTACCHGVSAEQSLMIGMCGGVLVVWFEKLFHSFRLDDVVSSGAVHGVCGVWGILCVGLFGDLELMETDLSRMELLLVQSLGALMCFAWGGCFSYVIWKTLDRIVPLRVSAQDEADGLNYSEHATSDERGELVKAMEEKVDHLDLSSRLPGNPFTESGQVAMAFNRLLDSLEKEITRSEAILEDLKEGILTVTKDGMITSANTGACELLGENGANGSILDCIKPVGGDGSVGAKSRWLYELEKGGYQFEAMMENKGKGCFPVEVSVTKSSGEEGERTLLVRDITRRKEYELELMRSREEAERVSRELTIRMNELERFNELAMGRELQMLDLKLEINMLERQLGHPDRYHLKKV